MDTGTHREVMTLIKAVPTLAKNSQNPTPHVVQEFLRAESPLPEFPELETLPVFPRRDRLGQDPDKGCSTSGTADFVLIPTTISHLATSALPSVPMRDEDEEDMAKEHLVIVNGWRKRI